MTAVTASSYKRSVTNDMKSHQPEVGVPVTIGAQTIVPSYVRPSESPLPNGVCVTLDLADPDEFTPTGYYIEFRSVDGGEQYRNWFPFEAFDGGVR